MRFLIALIIGVVIGAGVVWIYGTNRGHDTARAAGDQISDGAKSARDAVQDKLKALDLRSDDIRDELARTGQVVRRKAREAGNYIADATADARVTAAIKAKLLASRDLSALNISVNTTEGIVTMSGTVQAPDDISKAMLLAMETDGVREVVSTLQVKPRAGKQT
jgi:hyperosmotically inducible protein